MTTTETSPKPVKDTYKLQEVADKLGLHERTIRRKLKANLFPVRPIDRFTQQFLFPKVEVDRLVTGQLRRAGRR